MKFFLLVFALSIPFWLAGAATGLAAVTGSPGGCAHVRLPGDGGFDSCLRREQDRGRDRAAEAILRLRANQIEGLVRTYPSPDARRDGLVVWTDAPDGVAASNSCNSRFWRHLPCSLLSLSPRSVKSWAGRDTSLTRCRIGGARSRPGILLGLVWAAWHIVPLVQAHRSPAWIAWWSLGTVTTRIVMVWLYNNTGKSVFGVALFHAMINLCWQLFPIHGSYFDPRLNGLIMALIAAIVTVVWGPRTLSRRGC